MLTLGGYGGVRCDDNIDCEHNTSSALIGQMSASLASDWLISAPLSWQPRMHTWARIVMEPGVISSQIEITPQTQEIST